MAVECGLGNVLGTIEGGALQRFACRLLATQQPTLDIDVMVNRFLQWKLPAIFNPDAGISFTPEFNKEYMASLGKDPMRHEPLGTNLFDVVQAKAMIEHILGIDKEITQMSTPAPVMLDGVTHVFVGKRVFNVDKLDLNEGEYFRDNTGIFYAAVPSTLRNSIGGLLIANLANHDIIQHPDSTITVSPSILVEGVNEKGEPISWHGYLENGYWREV